MKKTLSVGSKTSEIRVRKGNDSDADGNDEEIVKTRLLTNERSLEDLHEQVNSLKEALQSLMQKVNSLTENPDNDSRFGRLKKSSEGAFIPVKNLKNFRGDLATIVKNSLLKSLPQSWPILKELR
jgi:predicted RNase H-like nuclease (RuvC/YqgF family)